MYSYNGQSAFWHIPELDISRVLSLCRLHANQGISEHIQDELKDVLIVLDKDAGSTGIRGPNYATQADVKYARWSLYITESLI